MHHGRLVISMVATLTVLGACSAPSPKPHPTHTATGTTTASACPATDVAKPDLPVVQMQPAGAPAYTIKKQVRLTCHAFLTVNLDGSVTAAFGHTATCVLSQGGSTEGILASRSPAGSFFSLDEGEVICYFNTPNEMPVMMCNMGELYISGQPSVIASCSANHLFTVAVHSGSVMVRYPTGTKMVYANHQLVYNFSTHAAPTPTVFFDSTEIAVFDEQARELGLSLSRR